MGLFALRWMSGLLMFFSGHRKNLEHMSIIVQ